MCKCGRGGIFNLTGHAFPIWDWALGNVTDWLAFHKGNHSSSTTHKARGKAKNLKVDAVIVPVLPKNWRGEIAKSEVEGVEKRGCDCKDALMEIGLEPGRGPARTPKPSNTLYDLLGSLLFFDKMPALWHKKRSKKGVKCRGKGSFASLQMAEIFFVKMNSRSKWRLR